MTELCDLCIKYGTDKGPREMNGWGYSPFYFEHFDRWRQHVRNVLEVGICGFRDIPNNVVGASLFVWRDFFPNAHIFGLDNDNRFMVTGQDKITTACVDAYDNKAVRAVLDEWGQQFDFICDDAVHDPIPQIVLLDTLWDYMAPDATYAIEDVCPYKLPHGNLEHMIRFFPPHAATEIIATHKEERLLLIR